MSNYKYKKNLIKVSPFLISIIVSFSTLQSIKAEFEAFLTMSRGMGSGDIVDDKGSSFHEPNRVGSYTGNSDRFWTRGIGLDLNYFFTKKWGISTSFDYFYDWTDDPLRWNAGQLPEGYTTSPQTTMKNFSLGIGPIYRNGSFYTSLQYFNGSSTWYNTNVGGNTYDFNKYGVGGSSDMRIDGIKYEIGFRKTFQNNIILAAGLDIMYRHIPNTGQAYRSYDTGFTGEASLLIFKLLIGYKF